MTIPNEAAGAVSAAVEWAVAEHPYTAVTLEQAQRLVLVPDEAAAISAVESRPDVYAGIIFRLGGGAWIAR